MGGDRVEQHSAADRRTASLSPLPRLGDWASLDELAQLQDAQIPRALSQACLSPFYRTRLGDRARWPATAAGLATLPTTTKADLREAYPFGFLAVPRERLATYHESSGTSGEPTASYFTDEDWDDVADRFNRGAANLGASDTVLVRTPYAMLTTGHQAHRAARLRGATVVPADNRSSVTPYGRVVRLLRDLQVTVAWCLPSECVIWAAAARAAGLRPERDFPWLRTFLVAGEPLTAARRTRISELWGGIPVVQDYGSTETGSLAGECPHGFLHLWADRLVPEVYDPATGRATAEGTGRLVVTTLYREAMPLVRYDTGDVVELSMAPCPCGWQLPAVRVRGRSSAGPGLANGKISQAEVEEFVYSLPVDYGVLFWRARRAGGGLEMEIEVEPSIAGAACAALGERLPVPATVRGVPPGTLMPSSVLADVGTFVKPRSLFDEHEDWSKAVTYY
jgi:phenylacetate-coenzyme A ligase PaaK-like adenylate-forming protein